MAFWKDKQGNKLTFKEFMNRWKQGIEGITPLQQARIQLRGTQITLLGILFGIIVTFLALKTLWWVLIILIGALTNTIAQWIGIYQKKLVFERIEETMKGGETYEIE